MMLKGHRFTNPKRRKNHVRKSRRKEKAFLEQSKSFKKGRKDRARSKKHRQLISFELVYDDQPKLGDLLAAAGIMTEC